MCERIVDGNECEMENDCSENADCIDTLYSWGPTSNLDKRECITLRNHTSKPKMESVVILLHDTGCVIETFSTKLVLDKVMNVFAKMVSLGMVNYVIHYLHAVKLF